MTSGPVAGRIGVAGGVEPGGVVELTVRGVVPGTTVVGPVGTGGVDVDVVNVEPVVAGVVLVDATVVDGDGALVVVEGAEVVVVEGAEVEVEVETADVQAGTVRTIRWSWFQTESTSTTHECGIDRSAGAGTVKVTGSPCRATSIGPCTRTLSRNTVTFVPASP